VLNVHIEQAEIVEVILLAVFFSCGWKNLSNVIDSEDALCVTLGGDQAAERSLQAGHMEPGHLPLQYILEVELTARVVGDHASAVLGGCGPRRGTGSGHGVGTDDGLSFLMDDGVVSPNHWNIEFVGIKVVPDRIPRGDAAALQCFCARQ